MKIAIVGGAGFIGSHLTDALVARGDDVVIFDPCLPPAHDGNGPPVWLSRRARLMAADPRLAPARFFAMAGDADVLVHLAALTGTGQSLYEVSAYAETNTGLTAWLAEAMVKGNIGPSRTVLASTRAVYGEGMGTCSSCGRVPLVPRTATALAAGQFHPTCPRCGAPAFAAPIKETDPTSPLTPYALTKLWAEQVMAFASTATGAPLTVLRLFNVYGPRQLATNPYVGVISAFARAVAEGEPVRLYEDGAIARDFLAVADAVAAFVAAIDRGPAGIFNVGSGRLTMLATVARLLGGRRIEVTGQARVGDPRAVVADRTKAERELGWAPSVDLAEGLAETLAFVRGHGRSAGVSVSDAESELAAHGLLVESARAR